MKESIVDQTSMITFDAEQSKKTCTPGDNISSDEEKREEKAPNHQYFMEVMTALKVQSAQYDEDNNIKIY